MKQNPLKAHRVGGVLASIILGICAQCANAEQLPIGNAQVMRVAFENSVGGYNIGLKYKDEDTGYWIQIAGEGSYTLDTSVNRSVFIRQKLEQLSLAIDIEDPAQRNAEFVSLVYLYGSGDSLGISLLYSISVFTLNADGSVPDEVYNIELGFLKRIMYPFSGATRARIEHETSDGMVEYLSGNIDPGAGKIVLEVQDGIVAIPIELAIGQKGALTVWFGEDQYEKYDISNGNLMERFGFPEPLTLAISGSSSSLKIDVLDGEGKDYTFQFTDDCILWKDAKSPGDLVPDSALPSRFWIPDSAPATRFFRAVEKVEP